MDAGTPIDVVYMDFAKAFDMFPHRVLIYKLEHLGIQGNLLSWIESLPSKGILRVRIGDIFQLLWIGHKWSTTVIDSRTASFSFTRMIFPG